MDTIISQRPGTFWNNLAGLFGWIVLCFAVAALGGWLTMLGMPAWYDSLTKPSWNPPNWIFGPVWTLLYLAMAVAAWLVWRERGRRDVDVALELFAVQLTLNLIWSGLFFALRSPGLAAAEIGLLWVAILATLVSFWSINRWAGMLFVPYLAWVSFASFLNFTIWRLNG